MRPSPPCASALFSSSPLLLVCRLSKNAFGYWLRFVAGKDEVSSQETERGQQGQEEARLLMWYQ